MKKLLALFLVYLSTFIATSAQSLSPITDFSVYMPEIRAFNKGLANFPKLDLSTPEALAAIRNAPAKPVKFVLEPQNRTIAIASGKVRLRIFKPQNPKGIVIDIHGGGWCIGNPDGSDAVNEQIAKNCHVAVISIDYKLAPENPIPNQINDCAEVIRWVLKNGKVEFGTEKIVLQGNSAGAHLAIAAALNVKGEGALDTRIVGFNLLYGLYDLSKTPSLRQIKETDLILSKHNLKQFWINSVELLNQNDLQNPALSPLYASLTGLPPVLFSVGTADALIDDTTFMAARWQTAGNKAVLDVYPECTHLFDTLPTKIAQLARERMNSWILQCVK
ncbi:MAG: alpha/beta hydrolase fold domain-containing protein [Spirosomataceae bacterium]